MCYGANVYLIMLIHVQSFLIWTVLLAKQRKEQRFIFSETVLERNMGQQNLLILDMDMSLFFEG